MCPSPAHIYHGSSPPRSSSEPNSRSAPLHRLLGKPFYRHPQRFIHIEIQSGGGVRGGLGAWTRLTWSGAEIRPVRRGSQSI